VPPTETIHATCVAVNGRGVLLLGPSGAGKSDLALRLTDIGGELVADDRVHLTVADGMLHASPPPALAGLLEVRGLGIVAMPYLAAAPVVLAVDLGGPPPERMPPPMRREFHGIILPLLRLEAFQAATPQKVRLAAAHADGDSLFLR
jgi:hypothetical protein